ncbi:MAG: NuoI/complex I 23 kDa subunit family protein [Candidatus Zhuqueibacterota bacterium]
MAYQLPDFPDMKYLDRHKRTLGDQLYVKEIGRGVFITTKHFFRNLFKWLTFRKGGAVILYPEENRPDLSPYNRGRHVLVQRTDGSPRCVACKMCATVCPALCITIEAEESDDPTIQKRPRVFEIDFSRCIFCGFCVEACPVDAIRMLATTEHLVGYNRFKMVYDKETLLNWNKVVNDDVVHGYNP